MYSSIRINGYRGFDSFRMERLGRVNLLVGTNNSGKTSILECIELLQSVGNARVLSSILGRRGELDYAGYRVAGTAATVERAPVDVTHLFPNREIHGEIVVEADCTEGADAADWNNRVTMYRGDAPDAEFDDADGSNDHENEQCVVHVRLVGTGRRSRDHPRRDRARAPAVVARTRRFAASRSIHRHRPTSVRKMSLGCSILSF